MVTAKEYLQFLVDELDLPLNEYHIEVISARMKGFAKLHVREAKQQIKEKIIINDFDRDEGYSPYVDEDSILNAYSEDNIK